MEKIIAYTDGSCLGNPGPGGWAFLILQNKKIIKKNSGLEYQTTNNRMEMNALLEVLKFLKINFSHTSITIFSDSNLLVQTLNLGWKKKANKDLWQQIDDARSGLDVKFEWVKAHHVDEYNNLCDEMAQKASQKAQKELSENPALREHIQKKSAPELHSENAGQTSFF